MTNSDHFMNVLIKSILKEYLLDSVLNGLGRKTYVKNCLKQKQRRKKSYLKVWN